MKTITRLPTLQTDCALAFLLQKFVARASGMVEPVKSFLMLFYHQVGANPIPIPHPTNLALFWHKITLYRFNQGAHTIAGSSNQSRD